jgi:hypothetical protein
MVFLCVIGGLQLVVMVLGLLYLRACFAGLNSQLQSLFVPDDDGKTPLDKIMQKLGSNVGVTLRQSLFGSEGAVARQGKAIMSDAAEDIIGSEHPALAAGLDLLGPKVKARVTKNPAALMALLQFLGPMMAGKPSNGGGGSQSGKSDFGSNLDKWR